MLKSMTKIPPARYSATIRSEIHDFNTQHGMKYIVLDDDPTGTQTVSDVTVITEWTVEAIKNELESSSSIFFILTNSRSLSAKGSAKLIEEIGSNINKAIRLLEVKVNVILRGDSTLRGHFPIEEIALKKGLQSEPDLYLLIPAFFEGGRYTIDNVHYYTDSQKLIPVSESPFAEDKVFGYESGNLKDWIKEKSADLFRHVYAFSHEDLQKGSDWVRQKLKDLPIASMVLVNATHYEHLDTFSSGLLSSGLSFCARSAASLVASLNGLPPGNFLKDLDMVNRSGTGGLIVVGSYVPKTTAQVSGLLAKEDLRTIMLHVEKILVDDGNYLRKLSLTLATSMRKDEDVVVMTERTYHEGQSVDDHVAIGQKVSCFIVDLVGRLQQSPRFIISKGGITSSDVATRALKVQKAKVLGQVIPGVPVWSLGATSRFPGLPYIIFPGNVGHEHSLHEVYLKLKTKEE
jgi:uncharacterized protein YgbK (DUF1537 family)